MVRVWWGALWFACGGPDGEAADREAYLASLHAPPEPSRAACQRIVAPTLRSECLLQVANRASLGADRAESERTCAEMDTGPWQAECWFLIADQLDVFEDDALALCERSGRFASNCRGHAFARDVHAHLGTPELGEERTWLAGARERARRYHPGARPQQVEGLAHDLLARELAARWAEGRFDVALCGEAPGRSCREALQQSLVPGGPEDLSRICAAARNSAAVEAAGGRGWTEASEALVLAELDRLCARPRR